MLHAKEDPTPCVRCKKTFATWKEYHLHKMNSDDHISCPICSADFLNIDGYRRHQKLAHAQEQDLACPGCGQVFTRVGGLMGHIEGSQCPGIRTYEARRAVIQQNSGYFNRIRERAVWGNTNDGATLGFTADESVPTRCSPVALDYNPSLPSDREPAVWNNHVEAKKEDKAEEVDLITFDTPNLALNSAWGPLLPMSIPPAAKFQIAKDFPPLGAVQSTDNHSHALNVVDESTRYKTEAAQAMGASQNRTGGWTQPPYLANGVTKKENIPPREFTTLQSSGLGRHSSPSIHGRETRPGVLRAATSIVPLPAWDRPSIIPPTPTSTNAVHPAWSTAKNLFPDAPVAVAPPAALLEQLSAPSNIPLGVGTKFALHDPSDPNFKIGKFWVSFTRKYKCPHVGCAKSLASAEAFKQHLNSAAHASDNKKLQCGNCLRYYGSATALTQHYEAQGVRCLIREKEQYGVYIDEITASTAATAGRHQDETIRYVVNEQYDPKSAAQKFIDSNAAAHTANEKAKTEFWFKNASRW